ncbi:MAG: hypothetical protein Ct9H300mP27_12260 [Chloroflexota bacterium]|nr:MAG: hypothetical protein Ct9H300mP27_12260 [Chloroflexota bacterium]
MTRAVEAGIGFSHIISTGNEADLDFCDFARYLIDDDSVKVIAGFVEGFKDAKKLTDVAKLAAAKAKPIVLIKIGRSDLGTRAARSHTAALTGIDDRYDAMFDQYGIIRVQGYDELLEISQLLAHSPKPTQPGIAVVSHSGGISSLTADMCGQAGLDLPTLTDEARDGINGILKGFGWASNPSDVTGFANSDSFPEIMAHMSNQPNIGSLVVASAGADDQATQVIAHRDDIQKQGKGVAFLWTGTRGATAGLQKLKEANVPVFYVPDKLPSRSKYVTKILHMAGDTFEPPISNQHTDKYKTIQTLAELKPPTSDISALSEHQSKQLIKAWDIPITNETLVSTSAEAVMVANQIGYPVVLKVDSANILHKTEAGVLQVGLDNDTQVTEAYDEIMANALRHTTPEGINGVLVQEMVSGGTEVIVGISYDDQLGPVLLFGSGGIMVEVYNDVSLSICPIDIHQAREMINKVKGARMLEGFRGSPKGDIEALANTLVNVSQLAVNLEGQLSELDINPLIVLPEGQGVKAVDALALF